MKTVIRGIARHKATGYIMDVCEHNTDARWCYRLMRRSLKWAVERQDTRWQNPDMQMPIAYGEFEITVRRVHPDAPFKD